MKDSKQSSSLSTDDGDESIPTPTVTLSGQATLPEQHSPAEQTTRTEQITHTEQITRAEQTTSIDQFTAIDQTTFTDQTIEAGVNAEAAIHSTAGDQTVNLLDQPESTPVGNGSGVEDEPICMICWEPNSVKQLFALCDAHWLCEEDLASVIELATNDDKNYPARCPADDFRLDTKWINFVLATTHSSIVEAYKTKEAEAKFKVEFRRYCHDGSCRTFLPPPSSLYTPTKTAARCFQCAESTCIKCGQADAALHECKYTAPPPDSYNGQDFRRKRCPQCKRLALLEEGCNHVQCECGARWCFVCVRSMWDYDHTSCKVTGDPDYDAEGFDVDPYHCDNGLDREGFDRDGVNVKGRNRSGEPVESFATREAEDNDDTTDAPMINYGDGGWVYTIPQRGGA